MGKKYERPLLPLIPPVFSKEEILENEWIAGLTDGDGYLNITGNRCHFEVTQARHNIHLLEFLKSKFGGRIWQQKRNILKGGVTFYYRVTAKEPMIKLAFMLNGNVRGTSRNEQFQRLCQLLNITYTPPVVLTKESGWYAGMFDADGSISFHFNEKRFTCLEVSSKYLEDVKFYLKDFKGRVQKCGPNLFSWTVTSKAEIIPFVDYLKSIPLKANKKIRVDMVNEYYELSKKRPLEKGSPYYQEWLALRERWYDNGADIYRKDCKGRPYTAKAREKRELEKLNLSNNKG
jgi:hypothetical protein